MKAREFGDVWDAAVYALSRDRVRWLDEVEQHMERYLANRAKRTGRAWHVVERYATDGSQHRIEPLELGFHQRALIEADNHERVRLWYAGSYWNQSR